MNEKIRKYAKAKSVKLWEVAERLGMWDTQFSKMLRHPLTPEQEQTILTVIDVIAAERNAD